MAINVVRTQFVCHPEGSHLWVFVTQLGSVGYSVIVRSLVVFATRDDTRFYSEILRVARAARALTPVRLEPMTSRHRGLFVPLAVAGKK